MYDFVNDRLLTVRQVSQFTQMKPAHVQHLCREGILPAIKMQHEFRISAAELNAYLHTQKVRADA